MNELMKVYVTDNGKAISARDLYQFLSIDDGSNFSKWARTNIEEMFSHNIDYQNLRVTYENGGRPATDYALTIDCAKEVAMMSRCERGKMARQYFIEVEKKFKAIAPIEKELPRTYVAALRELANEVELRELAENTVKELQPKAESYERFLDSEKYMTVADVAKTLRYKDAGPIQLYEILRKHGVLNSQPGNNWNLPNQRYLDQKLFVVKKTEKEVNGEVKYYSTTYVTPKGMERINSYLRNLGYKVIEL